MTNFYANLGSVGPLSNFPTSTTSNTDSGSGEGFGDVLKNALHSVNELNSGADQQIGNMISGNGSNDMSSVMVAVEKADVAFQLMMQVRNKIVNAYQDIEKMQF